MHWLTILGLSGCALAALLAVRLAVTRTENPAGAWTFAGFLVASAMFVVDGVFYREGWFARWPAFYAVANPFIAASAPLFFLYACAATDPAFRWRHLYWLHFLPGLLIAVLQAPVYLAPAMEKVQMAHADLAWNGSLLERFFSFGLIDLYLLAYFGLAWRRFWVRRERMFESIEEGRSHPLRGMGLFATLVLAINVVSAVLDFTPWVQGGMAAVALAGVVAIFAAFWNVAQLASVAALPAHATAPLEELPAETPPPAAAAEVAVAPEPKTEATPEPEPADEETKRLAAKLRRLFETEKLYLNADLSLHLLAEQLKTTRHRTSLAVKCAYGTTFYQVVAGFRAREAARVLQTRQGQLRTIADIAFASGFNTLSAFNAAFRNEFGRTPKVFRAEIAKKSAEPPVA